MSRQHGFSLLEAIIATALISAIMAVVFALVDPQQASFAAQSEAVDMQQRVRVAAGTLYKDLLMAGAGAYQGTYSGSFDYYFAPVLPYRQGSKQDDPPGTFRTDTITLMFVPPTVAQSTLSTHGPTSITGSIAAGCPSGDALCGFKSGMLVMLYDSSGEYDKFLITSVQSNKLRVQRNGGTLTNNEYQPVTTKITQLSHILYYLKAEAATGTYQLMTYDGGAGADVPVVDHVVALTFDYYGDPQPPKLSGTPLSDSVGPWTTYGPPPPQLTRQIPSRGYPAGENCTFIVDPQSGLQVPRLAVLSQGGAASGLVPLTKVELTDGPWCPDPVNANRWDADLLRIRRIGVTIRIESAIEALRGPAGTLFAHGGTSKGGSKWLPDQQVRFEIAPRNLELPR